MKLPAKPVLTLKLAQEMLSAAEARARELGLAMSIAIIDDGGHLISFARMDGIHAGTVEVAVAKARSAAMFKRPTASFQEGVAGGAVGLLALPNVLPFAGGLPLLADGHLVGAVGASGASPDKDAAVSAAAAELFDKEIRS